MRILIASALAMEVLVLCASTAAAQPVINDVTAVDVVIKAQDPGVGGVAQGGAARIWGDNVAKDIGSSTYPTTVFLNGLEVLSVGASAGEVYFRIPPDTPLGPATVAVEVDGVMSNQAAFTVSAYAPTSFHDADTFHLDGTRVDEQNPVIPGETLRATGITGLGADPSPVVTATLGGLPFPVASLVEGAEDYPYPGVYEATFVVPAGIGPGLQAVTLTIGGVTWSFPDDEDWQLFIGGGGGGGGGATPSIAEG
ncbi:MAG: hypothetical protein O3A53_06520 [Acidobacteria bacterium]|nr:hypothetical protein [Acidobacteriota bacterium]MDA1234436.1 hypothetical protein [Acidobacteriota bacterium]